MSQFGDFLLGLSFRSCLAGNGLIPVAVLLIIISESEFNNDLLQNIHIPELNTSLMKYLAIEIFLAKSNDRM